VCNNNKPFISFTHQLDKYTETSDVVHDITIAKKIPFSGRRKEARIFHHPVMALVESLVGERPNVNISPRSARLNSVAVFPGRREPLAFLRRVDDGRHPNDRQDGQS
jgi:hypothetical protein